MSNRRNWPLAAGSLIVLALLGIAIAGPALAPRDPLQISSVARVGSAYLRPPFPPFTVPGFPLGSDTYGRDLLSRLLWAVRPTMILVLVVAILRLVLGILLGVAAGWFTGWPGRVVETVISGALAVPVLVVALAAIAAIGADAGLLPFVVGLTLTGWAESARLVEGQTRLIKTQPYVECAKALGASDRQTIFSHVLRQITPLAGMLLAFEVSSTLLVVAALGFLGYYIGGGIWVEVEDFLAQRTTGIPELGQMLATSWVMSKPWATVVIGSVIFLSMLGFNLLGEGLQRRLSSEGLARRSLATKVAGRLGVWTEEHVPARAGAWLRGPSGAMGAGILLLVVVAGGLGWWRARLGEVAHAGRQDPAVALTIPGGHLWVGDRHDAQGSLGSQTPLLTNPRIAWLLRDEGGFPGGPAVAADGTAYIGSAGSTLYALAPVGSVVWQAPLPAPAAGAPALGAEGEVYVTDKAGGVSRYTQDGLYQWRCQSDAHGSATSGPIVGPQGAIFFTRGDFIQACSPDGKPIWASKGMGGYSEMPPRLSPSGDIVYLRDRAYRAGDGTPLELSVIQNEQAQYQDPAYLVGADGREYFRAGHNVIHWRRDGESALPIESVAWNYQGYTIALPADSGVTANQIVWLLYTSDAEDLRLVWLGMNSHVLGNIHRPQRLSKVIATDANAKTYVCGTNDRTPECEVFAPGAGEPLWSLPLSAGGRVVGGALVPGRLYVATEDGALYAIDGG